MNKKELFDKCIKEAIELGREHMNPYIDLEENRPTQQEWDLALLLFKLWIERSTKDKWTPYNKWTPYLI